MASPPGVGKRLSKVMFEDPPASPPPASPPPALPEERIPAPYNASALKRPASYSVDQKRKQNFLEQVAGDAEPANLAASPTHLGASGHPAQRPDRQLRPRTVAALPGGRSAPEEPRGPRRVSNATDEAAADGPEPSSPYGGGIQQSSARSLVKKQSELMQERNRIKMIISEKETMESELTEAMERLREEKDSQIQQLTSAKIRAENEREVSERMLVSYQVQHKTREIGINAKPTTKDWAGLCALPIKSTLYDRGVQTDITKFLWEGIREMRRQQTDGVWMRETANVVGQARGRATWRCKRRILHQWLHFAIQQRTHRRIFNRLYVPLKARAFEQWYSEMEDSRKARWLEWKAERQALMRVVRGCFVAWMRAGRLGLREMFKKREVCLLYSLHAARREAEVAALVVAAQAAGGGEAPAELRAAHEDARAACARELRAAMKLGSHMRKDLDADLSSHHPEDGGSSLQGPGGVPLAVPLPFQSDNSAELALNREMKHRLLVDCPTYIVADSLYKYKATVARKLFRQTTERKVWGEWGELCGLRRRRKQHQLQTTQRRGHLQMWYALSQWARILRKCAQQRAILESMRTKLHNMTRKKCVKEWRAYVTRRANGVAKLGLHMGRWRRKVEAVSLQAWAEWVIGRRSMAAVMTAQQQYTHEHALRLCIQKLSEDHLHFLLQEHIEEKEERQKLLMRYLDVARLAELKHATDGKLRALQPARAPRFPVVSQACNTDLHMDDVFFQVPYGYAELRAKETRKEYRARIRGCQTLLTMEDIAELENPYQGDHMRAAGTQTDPASPPPPPPAPQAAVPPLPGGPPLATQARLRGVQVDVHVDESRVRVALAAPASAPPSPEAPSPHAAPPSHPPPPDSSLAPEGGIWPAAPPALMTHPPRTIAMEDSALLEASSGASSSEAPAQVALGQRPPAVAEPQPSGTGKASDPRLGAVLPLNASRIVKQGTEAQALQADEWRKRVHPALDVAFSDGYMVAAGYTPVAEHPPPDEQDPEHDTVPDQLHPWDPPAGPFQKLKESEEDGWVPPQADSGELKDRAGVRDSLKEVMKLTGAAARAAAHRQRRAEREGRGAGAGGRAEESPFYDADYAAYDLVLESRRKTAAARSPILDWLSENLPALLPHAAAQGATELRELLKSNPRRVEAYELGSWEWRHPTDRPTGAGSEAGSEAPSIGNLTPFQAYLDWQDRGADPEDSLLLAQAEAPLAGPLRASRRTASARQGSPGRARRGGAAAAAGSRPPSAASSSPAGQQRYRSPATTPTIPHQDRAAPPPRLPQPRMASAQRRHRFEAGNLFDAVAESHSLPSLAASLAGAEASWSVPGPGLPEPAEGQPWSRPPSSSASRPASGLIRATKQPPQMVLSGTSVMSDFPMMRWQDDQDLALAMAAGDLDLSGLDPAVGASLGLDFSLSAPNLGAGLGQAPPPTGPGGAAGAQASYELPLSRQGSASRPAGAPAGRPNKLAAAASGRPQSGRPQSGLVQKKRVASAMGHAAALPAAQVLGGGQSPQSSTMRLYRSLSQQRALSAASEPGWAPQQDPYHAFVARDAEELRLKVKARKEKQTQEEETVSSPSSVNTAPLTSSMLRSPTSPAQSPPRAPSPQASYENSFAATYISIPHDPTQAYVQRATPGKEFSGDYVPKRYASPYTKFRV